MSPEKVQSLMDQGVAAFNAGDFYEAHEFWEEVWNEADDPDFLWVQGLIQFTTACHKIEGGYADAAQRLLRKSLNKLENAPTTRWNISLDNVRTWAKNLANTSAVGDEFSVSALKL